MILTTSFYGMSQKIKTKNAYIPKYQLIPTFHFQVMHDYVCSITPIDYCVEKSLVYETLKKVSCTSLSVKIALFIMK